MTIYRSETFPPHIEAAIEKFRDRCIFWSIYYFQPLCGEKRAIRIYDYTVLATMGYHYL